MNNKDKARVKKLEAKGTKLADQAERAKSYLKMCSLYKKADDAFEEARSILRQEQKKAFT